VLERSVPQCKFSAEQTGWFVQNLTSLDSLIGSGQIIAKLRTQYTAYVYGCMWSNFHVAFALGHSDMFCYRLSVYAVN